MKDPLGVSPSKGDQGTTRGKEKILLTSVGIEPTTSGLDLPLLCRLSYEVGQRKPVFECAFGQPITDVVFVMFGSDRVSVKCKLTMTWYLMRRCVSWVCPCKVTEFLLTWPAHILSCWNKRKCFYIKRVGLPQDWFGTPTWLPFNCFRKPIWLPRSNPRVCDKSLEMTNARRPC